MSRGLHTGGGNGLAHENEGAGCGEEHLRGGGHRAERRLVRKIGHDNLHASTAVGKLFLNRL
jgi:hypothetical protein